MSLERYLPQGFEHSPEVTALTGVLEQGVARVWNARDGFFDQLTLGTATWGLAWWEEALGIPTEAGKSHAFRRSRIRAKLRGQGVTTPGMLAAVASSYTDMDVELEELFGDYTVKFWFIGGLGEPVNLEALGQDLAVLMPAHLAWAFAFRHQISSLTACMAFPVHVADTMTFTMTE